MEILKTFFIENKRVTPFLIFIFIFIIIFALLIGNLIISNNRDLNIIIADTQSSREKGLSGMEKLEENSIMLFLFEKLGKYGFWMRDMKFPIDIIWLNNEYEIVHMEENVLPDTFPKIFYPKEESLYVVEANAGFIKKNKLKINNILNLKR